MCRSRFVQLTIVIISLALSPSLAGANSITINYTDSGAYNGFAGGFHNAANQTYIAGLCPASDCALSDLPFHNFFVFDLSAISETIVSATLQLNTGSVVADGTYTLYDVQTDIATLRAGGFGLSDVYADLGTGTAFGSINLLSTQDNAIVNIGLNTSAIGGINAARGGLFALGGDYMSPFSAFGNNFVSLDSATRQLVLETSTVPEPSSLLFLAFGLVALEWWRRKQQVY